MYRPYNPHCLVGNWYEDRVLEEDVIKDFLERKQNGALLSQKMVQYESIEAQPVVLTTSPDGFVHFGDVLMLKCDGTEANRPGFIAKAARRDCFLNGEFVRRSNENLIEAQGTILSRPNKKNAFVLRSVDGSVNGSVLRYGQPFALSSLDGHYYLHSETRTIDRASHKSRLQVANFQNVYNHECDWVVTSLNPAFRLETEGRSVPANEKVIILHMKTNKALGVVTDFRNRY
jgi:hypothetical protein